VDLVQTGSTLAANGLVETETIAHVTSRLIVNRTALKTRPSGSAPGSRACAPPSPP
jgi:ATP phosphoribosyltransferase